MNTNELFNELEARIMKERGTTSITASTLAKELGVTVNTLKVWKGRESWTAAQVAELVERRSGKRRSDLVQTSIIPIGEFVRIDAEESKQGAKWEIFGDNDTSYMKGLKSKLKSSNGIYIFYDSRGRAIYAGKAAKQSLWKEMNDAFNRHRPVQRVFRVDHPSTNVDYRGYDEQRRKINPRAVELHDIAHYFSGYQVQDVLINKVEAILVRAFANDLLNIRMENI